MNHFLLGIEQGGVLMLIGMGVVFSFLCVLVLAMIIMSKVVTYLNTVFPEAVVEVKTSKKSASANKLDDTIVAAIAAAISRKRV